MAGRKSIFEPEKLKVGERIQLNPYNKAFANQYAMQFRERCKGRYFKRVAEGNKVYIERTA